MHPGILDGCPDFFVSRRAMPEETGHYREEMLLLPIHFFT
jgi:hypothetical protein